ncbi:16504_t:CDS:2 [Funneliformis mosseae]|uniref:16504_t:CDS:1 n=1 Tax=Funneliformis mosseae TaxID=27381 RepID=A0A9N9FSN3_FUNMO|nr:16504_t:CDS:2 [Funneliformis mosseae]
MESERSNNIPPLAIEEEIFDENIPDRSIPYHTIQLTAPINSQRKSAQGGSETCSFCNEPDLLFELDRANLEPVLSNKSQDFNPLPMINVKMENLITPDMAFVELHNKILDAEKILKKKTREVSCIEYEILDSHYPLEEALEKKLA